MEIVRPSVQYKTSFIEAVDEYQKENESDKHLRNEHYKILQIEEFYQDFEGYIANVLSHSNGENLQKGYVPESTYWLVESGEYIGRVSIRHELNEHLLRVGGHIGYDIRPSQRGKGYGNKILELALPKARGLGIENVLITCNANNIPSKKVIEANGGILENSEKMGEGEPEKLRYWIKLNT